MKVYWNPALCHKEGTRWTEQDVENMLTNSQLAAANFLKDMNAPWYKKLSWRIFGGTFDFDFRGK